MTEAKAGAGGANRAGDAKPIVRPVSPHLQVWRWHVTMLASILHRVSGVALYAGAILVVGWLVAVAAGADAYAVFLQYAGSPLGLLVWFGLSAASFYHLASGLRHLVWDTGLGLSPKTANVLSAASIWFAVLATVAFWTWLFLSGKVSL